MPRIFYQRDADALSVDRLDHATDVEMAEIVDRTANQPKPLLGWAEVSVTDAEEDGRSVIATPLPDNEYHADIQLNLPADVERKDAANDHATNLAAKASWRGRP